MLVCVCVHAGRCAYKDDIDFFFLSSSKDMSARGDLDFLRAARVYRSEGRGDLLFL